MEKNNRQTKKLPGFYIALCCCVIAIGVAGFIVNNSNENESLNRPVTADETDEPYFAFDAEATVAPLSEATEEATESEAETTEDAIFEAADDYTYDNPDVVSASVTVNAEESCDFSDPLSEMTILYGFCADTLMYNEVYGDWRTHNGIDIEAPVGCSVNATANGTVTDVSQGSFGKTVTVDHQNGFISIYAQLGEVNVNTGDTIEQGSVIGTVGESVGENTDKPHLHYELYKDNKPVNPEEY